MNDQHAKLCPSPEWATHLQVEQLPRLTDGIELGGAMLEMGPGPGAATEWLRHRVEHLTAVELDAEAAGRLAERYESTNVEVVVGDAAGMAFADDSFSSVATFTMLHHVPTVVLQTRVLSEAFRVLRPSGVLFGSDSLASNDLHDFHLGDTYNPVEPSALLVRLQTLGFDKITLTVDRWLGFVAHKPARPPAGGGAQGVDDARGDARLEGARR